MKLVKEDLRVESVSNVHVENVQNVCKRTTTASCHELACGEGLWNRQIARPTTRPSRSRPLRLNRQRTPLCSTATCSPLGRAVISLTLATFTKRDRWIRTN